MTALIPTEPRSAGPADDLKTTVFAETAYI